MSLPEAQPHQSCVQTEAVGGYRPDIDGLRAICILAVVMFHAGFDDWSGGFVGVDIFFVISGFLITSLILRQMNEGQFSLLGFYERRVRRLLAATIPVLIFTTVFAFTFYTSDNLLTYCKSLLAFVTYTSNWFFLSETGYFGTPPEVSPLLHSWSLAIEEQFYLIFPALLLVLVRFPRATIWCLAGLALLSLGYSQLEISRGLPDRAFFSSLSRFWELLAGAALAVAPWIIDRTKAVALPLRLLGLAMVIAPVFLYGPATPFPGLAALLPCCGALLIIAASPDSRDPAWKVLTAPAVVYLGRISYSLYLWHWPIFGATRTLMFERNDFYMALAIALSVALAALSYHWIEQPVRTRRVFARGRHMAAMLASVSAAALAFVVAGWSSGGWPARFGPGVEEMAARAAMRFYLPPECYERDDTIRTERKFCTYGAPKQGPIDLLLWGDSHASAIFTAFSKYADDRDLSLAFAGRGGCQPLLDTWRLNQLCREFNDSVRDYIRDNNVRLIVLVARWSEYADGRQPLRDEQHPQSDRATTRKVFERALSRTFDELKNRAVVVVEQVPQHKGKAPNAYLVFSRIGGSLDSIATDPVAHQKQQRFVTQALDRAVSSPNVVRIDPAKALCAHKRCLVQANGKLLYADHNHLNRDGSLFIYPFIQGELDRHLASSPETAPITR
jgi:peptidoglycan/LPS O-acetylase OafA/YrhL